MHAKPTAARGLTAGLLLALALLAPPPAAAEAPAPAAFQAVVADYLAARGEIERISGVAAYVSLGDPGPALELFAGTTAIGGGEPVSGETLFQIGSNTKGFTGALILALEAQGKLDIDQTVGDWLPLYPAWQAVTIRSLLNMTSGIPTYSESVALNRLWARDPQRHYSLEELVDYAYPSERVALPATEGWFYSNTNYILAGMIAERASGLSYQQALEQLLFAPAGLTDSFYAPVAYPPAVLERLASGYFHNPDCGLYQPDCSESALAPLLGQDMRSADLSWAGPAGGIVSSPRELARWIRALFAGRVLPPPQLAAFLSLVSTATGQPLAAVTPEEPRGFSLGLVRVLHPELGALWFYEGETLGYRSAFLYAPETDILVAAATNSQPPGGEDQLVPMLGKLYALALQAAGD